MHNKRFVARNSPHCFKRDFSGNNNASSRIPKRERRIIIASFIYALPRYASYLLLDATISTLLILNITCDVFVDYVNRRK